MLARTHARTHAHTHAHTHFLTPCPLRMLGRIYLVYNSSPFCPVFHYLLPVGHSYQVPADHVNPSQWSSTWPSLIPLWFAPQELLLGAMVGHPLHMPSHCSRLCLTCSSIGNSLISFRMSTFRCMSRRVSPRMSQRHLINHAHARTHTQSPHKTYTGNI